MLTVDLASAAASVTHRVCTMQAGHCSAAPRCGRKGRHERRLSPRLRASEHKAEGCTIGAGGMVQQGLSGRSRIVQARWVSASDGHQLSV